MSVKDLAAAAWTSLLTHIKPVNPDFERSLFMVGFMEGYNAKEGEVLAALQQNASASRTAGAGGGPHTPTTPIPSVPQSPEQEAWIAFLRDQVEQANARLDAEIDRKCQFDQET